MENTRNNDKDVSRELVIPFSMENLKNAFPELKNLEGRFLHLNFTEWKNKTMKVLEELEEEIKEFIEFASEQLGDKLCYDEYYGDTLCDYCKNLVTSEYPCHCKIYPQMGQKWKGNNKDDPAYLYHPQSFFGWYWCIRICPDFVYNTKGNEIEKKDMDLDMDTDF